MLFDINFADRNFSLLAKPQFHLSPPVPKKVPKWSLDHALESLQTPRFQNNSASLYDPLPKTISLVAITSGNRCSELAACKREGITFEDKSHYTYQGRLPLKDPNYGQVASSSHLPVHNHKTPALSSLRSVLLTGEVVPSASWKYSFRSP